MDLILDRWFHILAGIIWIGLLYYFNFVQAVAMPKAKADNTAGAITKHVAPLALLWFRGVGIFPDGTLDGFFQCTGHGDQAIFGINLRIEKALDAGDKPAFAGIAFQRAAEMV